jgi:hypothetical protein
MITPSTKTSVSDSGRTHRTTSESVIPLGKDTRRRQRIFIAGVGGAALVVTLALLLIFRPWQKPIPRIGGEPSKLGQFVGTADFQKMDFEKREIYMKMASAKKDEIAKSYADGQLSLEDYQKALLAAHLGKRLDDMRKYFAKPMGAPRAKYLDKLVTKKESKKQALDHDPAAKEIEDEQDLLKDDAAEAAEIATWPGDIQAKYKEFHDALSERKKAFKEANEAKSPKKSTTTPVTRQTSGK